MTCLDLEFRKIHLVVVQTATRLGKCEFGEATEEAGVGGLDMGRAMGLESRCLVGRIYRSWCLVLSTEHQLHESTVLLYSLL